MHPAPAWAGPLTCSVTLGLALTFPGPPLPPLRQGQSPLSPASIPFLGLCIQSALYRCRSPPSPGQVVPCGFRPSSLLLLPPSLFSGEGSSPRGEGLGGAVRGGALTPGHPFSWGSRRAGDPAGIERGTWTVELAASRGHCLRPRGSIRRALGVKYHFQSRPGHRGGGGGGSEAGVAPGGLRPLSHG